MAIPALRRGACVLVYLGGAKDVFRPYWERDRATYYEALNYQTFRVLCERIRQGKCQKYCFILPLLINKSKWSVTQLT